MGALIMTHSDDQGLILPPNLAPFQVVIIPIYHGKEEFLTIKLKCEEIKDVLIGLGFRVKLDIRDTHKPGWKFNEYEVKGVPVRIALGMRDLNEGYTEVFRRDSLSKERVKISELGFHVSKLLVDMQSNIFNKAKLFLKKNTFFVDSLDEFKEKISMGGFVYAHWDGTANTEERIKKMTKATIRCIPIKKGEKGSCILTGKPSVQRVIFAKAY
jgi:prolyl-tRNA synthetase